MNSKTLHTLSKRFGVIEKGVFDEDDVKLFLIEIRDYLEQEGFLREICDFVAHPKRSRGICHRRIDSRYGKFKFSKEGFEKLQNENVFQNHPNKPWSFFSDQALSYIDTNKIEKKLFEIIIKEGIEEIDEDLFVQYYRLRKEGVRALIDIFYKKKKGYYVLIENISKEEYQLIDDLLKFIRGTITGKEAFHQIEIQNELLYEIDRVSQKYAIETDLTLIRSNIDDVIVCILSILSDATFELFDNNKASSYLSVQSENIGDEVEPSGFTLCIMANAQNFCFPVIVTSIPIIKYIDNSEVIQQSLNEIEVSYVKRNSEGKLVLIQKKT